MESLGEKDTRYSREPEQVNNGQRGACATWSRRDTPKRIDAAGLQGNALLVTSGSRATASKLVCNERVPGRLRIAGPCILLLSRQVANPAAAHQHSPFDIHGEGLK